LVFISSISQPRARKPLTIKSASLEESGLRNLDGVLAMAARIRALFVTDFEPGITTRELIGFAADEVNLLRNGAFQLVICPSLPSAYLSNSGI